jgi:hypothetical protein
MMMIIIDIDCGLCSSCAKTETKEENDTKSEKRRQSTARSLW